MATASELGAYIASLVTAIGLDTANDLLLIWDASEQTLISETIDDTIPASGPGGGYTEGAKVSRGSTLAVNSGSIVEPTFDLEEYDTDGIHDTVTNPERLTCQTEGLYLIIANVAWEADANGYRQATLVMNEGTLLASSFVQAIDTADIDTIQQVMTTAQMTVGDYITLWVRQNSGSTLDLTYASYSWTNFLMQRIG